MFMTVNFDIRRSIELGVNVSGCELGGTFSASLQKSAILVDKELKHWYPLAAHWNKQEFFF